MTVDPGQCLLACGFVADGPDEGSLFPSAGGNSADPGVQAVYWRCIAMFFASARLTNPGLRLTLFSNVAPPVVDGVDIGAVLARYGVELRRVALAARLEPGRTQAWGNVLYFHDIMADLAEESPDLRIALGDCDMLVMADLAPLFALLDDAPFAGYVVEETRPDEDVNGLTPLAMQAIAHAQNGTGQPQFAHFGGELFMTTPAAWARWGSRFTDLLDQARSGRGPAAAITTEEHMFSVVFDGLPAPVARANGLLKRMWTGPRYRTVQPGDERHLVWHLPAEKRYGLADLFARFAWAGWPLTLDGAQWRSMAGETCGVPKSGPAKLLRDGVRQIGAKLGLRT